MIVGKKVPNILQKTNHGVESSIQKKTMTFKESKHTLGKYDDRRPTVDETNSGYTGYTHNTKNTGKPEPPPGSVEATHHENN